MSASTSKETNSDTSSNNNNMYLSQPSERVNAYKRPPIIHRNGSLTFVYQKVAEIPDVLWKLYASKTKRLDVSNNLINTLKSVEKFEFLTELILDNNRISELGDFPVMHSLKCLSLNTNRIRDLEMFIKKISVSFPNLTFLSLLCNFACPHQLTSPDFDDDDYRRYRLYVVHHLRRLRYLDSTPVLNEEYEEAVRIGHLLHIRKPHTIFPTAETRSLGAQFMERVRDQVISDAPLRHQGAYVRGEYRFTNKESEGNRFILNQDL